MVANRVGKGIDLAYFGKLISPLKMSKDKMYAENIPEWEEGIKNAFATAGIGNLLSKFSGVMAPPDQVAKVQVERELGVVLSGMKPLLPSMSPLTKSEPPMMGPPSTSSDGKPLFPQSPRRREKLVLSEAQRVAELQAHIRETAREMTEQLQIEHAQSESRGVRKEVIFLEYLSSVPVEKAYLNPKATILVTFEDVTKLFEPESDLKRLQRQSGWQLITQSISDMPPANWKSIALGNVHGLYTLITSHYRENDRKSVVKALNERLTALAKSRSELFVTFHGRYEQLVLEMEKVGMNVDDDMMYTHVERALKMSDDETLVKIYDSVLLISGKPETAEALFSKLLPAMKRHENDARTKHDLNGDKTENDARTNRDLNDERERELKKKKEENLRASTFKARTDDSTALSSGDIIGTCLEFSETGKCPRMNCSFKHRKLNDSQTKRLKEMMKTKRDITTCYACGEKGHIATHCPKQKNERTNANTTNRANTKTTKIVTCETDDDSMRTMRASTNHMSDEQVKMFARELMAARGVSTSMNMAEGQGKT
jgi:hypothetical protein